MSALSQRKKKKSLHSVFLTMDGWNPSMSLVRLNACRVCGNCFKPNRSDQITSQQGQKKTKKPHSYNSHSLRACSASQRFHWLTYKKLFMCSFWLQGSAKWNMLSDGRRLASAALWIQKRVEAITPGHKSWGEPDRQNTTLASPPSADPS